MPQRIFFGKRNHWTAYNSSERKTQQKIIFTYFVKKKFLFLSHTRSNVDAVSFFFEIFLRGSLLSFDLYSCWFYAKNNVLSCPFGRIIVGKTSASTPPFDLKLFILTWKIFAQFLIVSFYFRFNFNLMWHIIIVVVIVIVITITTRIIIKTERDDGGKKKYTNMFAIRFSFKYSPFRIQIFFSKMSRHTQMLDLDFVVWHHATLENVDNSEQNRLQKMVIIAKCCWKNWQRRTHTKSPLQVNTFRSEIKSLRTKANEGHQKKVESMACKAKAKIWAKKNETKNQKHLTEEKNVKSHGNMLLWAWSF